MTPGADLLIPGAGTILIGIVGWLLKRAVEGLDQSIKSLSNSVALLSAKDSQHDSALIELRLRVGAIEIDTASDRQRLNDFGGFLQSQGFKKRDG